MRIFGQPFLTQIKVKADSTDHLAFFCPLDNAVMKVFKVRTKQVKVKTSPPEFDTCSWIHLKCPRCGGHGHRKFYWTAEDGEGFDDE